jgi:hypothetical protein
MKQLTRMKTVWLLFTLLLTTPTVCAQQRTDPRSLSFMGMPLEGLPDSVSAALVRMGFTPWGTDEDNGDMNFRGNFYGIRSKLLIGCDEDSKLVTSAFVTIGPYRTKEAYDRNLRYFIMKLQKDYGTFSLRSGAYFNIGDYGLIKVSGEDNETGIKNIKVFFFNTSPFYKDAAIRGLNGNVMEVATTNPVAEEAVEHFDRQGRLVQEELTERQYDVYGYLLTAKMKEEKGGYSTLVFTYDDNYRLKRRTLTNTEAGIRYVNEYTWNDDDEITMQTQKVFDKNNECVMSLILKNQYDKRDSKYNWTQNTLKLTYWDPKSESQQTPVLQKRTVSYWEDE